MARRGKGPRGAAVDDGQQRLQPLLQKATETAAGSRCCTEARSSRPESEAVSDWNGASSSSSSSSSRTCCNGKGASSRSSGGCCNGQSREMSVDNADCSSNNQSCGQQPQRAQQQQQQRQRQQREQELMTAGPQTCGGGCGSTCSADSDPQHEHQGMLLSPSQVSGGSSDDPCTSPPQHQQEAQQQQGAEEAGQGGAVEIPMQRGTRDSSPDDSRVLRRQLAVDTAATRARRKLLVASAVCLVFMAIEVVAGVISNSLALMTDASHLLSDLCAFLISLFALWVSQLKGTMSMSFGYHRAEILGALLSVLLIWGVTAALVVAALHRIASPQRVQGGLMFLTASIGTAANLFMAHILHIHSHGIGRIHTTHTGLSADGDGHGSNSSGGCCSSGRRARPLLPLRTHGCCGDSSRNSSSSGSSGSSHDTHGHHKDEGNALLLQRRSSDLEQQRQQAATTTTEDDVYVRMEEDDPEAEIESMNLRAAYIHAVGDLLQNIGVMIASAIIWYNPEYSIADPACTLVFSMFVLLTTISIIREAVNVLMEGTPLGLDVAVLQSDLVSLRGVLEVMRRLHDAF